MSNLKKPTEAVENKPLSKQHQSSVDAAKIKTKNDGSHIAQQRAARLADAEKAQENN